jgi:hypothetical protein
MAARISIVTDSAAFEDSGKGTELARILRALATKMEDLQDGQEIDQRLLDANGNTVGWVTVDA